MWLLMKRRLVNAFIFALGIYTVLCLGLYIFQRSLIYFPQGNKNFGELATITLETNDGNVIVITKKLIGEKALIYFGGNAEDVSQSLQLLSKAFPDFSIYLLNYRGYGGSAGKPSEEAIIGDAEKLFDIVHANHKEVILIGRSLGSGVAVHVASKHSVQRLILITPYDSIQAVAAKKFKYFPVRWLLKDKFESWKYAPQIMSPTLLIAAEHDEVIPRERTINLFLHFQRGIADLKILQGVGHNNIENNSEYIQLLRDVW